MKPVVITEGVGFAEGPVWCPDGTLVVSHLAPGCLRRVWPASGRSEIIARTGGSANAAQLTSDGGFVLTQNGGIDFMVYADALSLTKENCPPYEPVAPGLQRVSASGQVTYLTAEPLNAPNDLVVDRNGTIYFTDPGHPPTLASCKGRLMALDPDGCLRVVANGFRYDNGIALSPDGRLLVVEANGLMWVSPAGEKEWLLESLGDYPGDGFCFDVDGRIYVACPLAASIYVIDSDGTMLDAIRLPAGSMVTNVCFGGTDLRTLFAVEIAPGRVHAIEHMPAIGVSMHAWPVPQVEAP